MLVKVSSHQVFQVAGVYNNLRRVTVGLPPNAIILFIDVSLN